MRQTSTFGGAPYVLLAFAIGFLGFVAGTFVVFAEAFPARYVTNAYRGGQALINKVRAANEPFPGALWQTARRTARGVTIQDPARSSRAPTLYAVGHDQRALLVAPSGEILNESHLPFSEVWDSGAALADPQPDALIYYRKAHLYPNGDLLVIYRRPVSIVCWGQRIDPASLDPSFRALIEQPGDIT